MSKKFDPTEQISNTQNPKPPIFHVSTGLQNILNYSIQTGEEFSLEFMRERANSRRPFNPNINYVDERQTQIMANVGQRKENKEQSKEITNKSLALIEPERRISSSVQASSKRFLSPQLTYNLVQSKVIKFLCSFSGKFLPRPSDGKIRYVGGETYIIQIKEDITFRELMEKTVRLYNRPHTIKYHLPEEPMHVLILVSCDEDVHHMIEECIVLEGGEDKPRLFLFSTEEVEEDSDIHYGLASVDAETEARFVAAVNGLAGSVSGLGSDYSGSYHNAGPSVMTGELDQMIFYIDADSANCGSYSGGIAIPRKRSSNKPLQGNQDLSNNETYGTSLAIPVKRQSKILHGNQDCMAQYDEREIDSYMGKSSKVQLAFSVPSEFEYNKPGVKPHSGIRQNYSGFRAQEQELSRMVSGFEMSYESQSPDIRNFENRPSIPKIPEATSEDDKFHELIARIYSKYEDNVLQNNTSSKSDDLVELPQLPIKERIRVSSDDFSLLGKFLDSDATPIIQEGFEEELEQIKLDYKQRRYGSQEEPIFLPDVSDQIGRGEGESYKRKILRQKTIERSDLDNSIKSRESSANIIWHDDMGISLNSRSLARKIAKEELLLKDVRASQQAKKINLKSLESKKDQELNHSIGGDSSSVTNKETVDPVQQVSRIPIIVTSDSHKNESNDESLLKDRNLLQGGENVRLSVSEFEDHEHEGDNELSLPRVDSLGKEIEASNVQIIRNDDLEDLRELGSGAFGTVYHGKWRGTDVAIKRLKNSCFTYPSSQTDKLILEFWREAEILSKLHHPNIVAFYGVVQDGPGGTFATVTEFMVSGSLKKVLLRKDRYLDRRKRIMLAMDAAFGMEYLHSKGVIHFDLKCDNLLVNLKDPTRPICKVADFGLSKVKQTSMVSGGMRGTLPWMAPEQLNISSSKVSDKIDVYAFGIVMWEILTGDEPYAGMHYGAVIGGIMNNTLRPPVPPSCEPDWRKLMERCWSAKPENRPTFTEIAGFLRAML